MSVPLQVGQTWQFKMPALDFVVLLIDLGVGTSPLRGVVLDATGYAKRVLKLGSVINVDSSLFTNASLLTDTMVR